MSPSSRAAGRYVQRLMAEEAEQEVLREGGNRVVCLVEEIDADAVEGLPEADVELELHARLLSEPPRFRIRWDDGHTSIFTPSAGSASIEKRKKARKA